MHASMMVSRPLSITLLKMPLHSSDDPYTAYRGHFVCGLRLGRSIVAPSRCPI